MRLERGQPFDTCYSPEPNSGCWLWMGRLNHKGYGHMFPKADNGWQTLAHRASWIRAHGAIPEDHFVLHKCDVPCCVNPAHLFLGGYQENMDDMVAKGRSHKPIGTRNGRAKLTEDDVRRIRQDARPNTTICLDYGVSNVVISNIKLGKSWRNVT